MTKVDRKIASRETMRVQRQRIVRRGGEHRVIAVVDVRQQHLQMIVHIGHAGDPLRRGRRLQILRIARHGAVERHLPGDVLHGDVRRVYQRVELQLRLDRLADIRGLSHC